MVFSLDFYYNIENTLSIITQQLSLHLPPFSNLTFKSIFIRCRYGAKENKRKHLENCRKVEIYDEICEKYIYFFNKNRNMISNVIKGRSCVFFYLIL